MDARLSDQPHHSLVSAFVLLAHVLHQVEQQLAAQHLVPVHPGNVAELRLSWRGGAQSQTADQSQPRWPVT